MNDIEKLLKIKQKLRELTSDNNDKILQWCQTSEAPIDERLNIWRLHVKKITEIWGNHMKNTGSSFLDTFENHAYEGEDYYFDDLIHEFYERVGTDEDWKKKELVNIKKYFIETNFRCYHA